MSHAYIYTARERCNNACLLVFSLRFSTKYALFCVISDFVLLLVFADASCLINTVAIQKICFAGKGHWTWSGGGDSSRSLGPYPIPRPSRGSGGTPYKLPQGGLGRSPSRKQCLDILCAILCHFIRVLVHFGRWLSGIITQKIQQNITGVGKVTLHACIFNWMICNQASVASEKIFAKVRARV